MVNLPFSILKKYLGTSQMLKILLCILLALTFSNVSFSQISKSEWIQRCQNSKGQTLQTYMSLVKETTGYAVSPTYKLCKKAHKFLASTDLLVLESSNLSDLGPLSPFKNITYLRLRGNQISDLRPLSFLTNLKALDLSVNRVSDSDLLHLTSLTNLTSLELHTNQISDITPLASLGNLEQLYLSGNKISELIHLSSLTNLKSLELDANQISDISPLSSLVNLNWLNLSSNKVSDISPLSSLINLTYLYLSNNEVSELIPLSFLTSLRTLDLDSNEISELSPLESLTNLTNLDLDSNEISELSPLESLTNLSSLSLNGNRIRNISSISYLTNLSMLYLSNNQVSELSPLSSLTNLVRLGLLDNKINELGPLGKLTNLENLGLRGNYINDLTPLKSLNKLIPEDYLNYIEDNGMSTLFFNLLWPWWQSTSDKDEQIEIVYEDLMHKLLTIDSKFVTYSAEMAIRRNLPSEFFQMLVECGAELGVGSFSWGKLYDLAENESHSYEIRKIIENTHNELLWNKSSSKERFALAKKKAKEYEEHKRYDSELTTILDTLEGEHVIFLNFEKALFGHETEIFSGNKEANKIQGVIVGNAIRKIFSNKNMTTRFMGSDTDKFHMIRGANFDSLINYLDKYEDELEVLILSGHGFEDDKGSGKYCFGRESESIDFSVFSKKSLSKLKIIALSACYPNKVANEFSKFLPSSVAILHTDSDEKTKCHDFENVVEYMMGRRVKNTQLTQNNLAIKCVFGSNCTCTRPEGIRQLKCGEDLFSGSARYSPVKITWGTR